MNEVLVTPRVAEFAGLPGVVHRQERKMIALRLVELGLLRVCLSLLLFWPIKDVLDTEHGYDG